MKLTIVGLVVAAAVALATPAYAANVAPVAGVDAWGDQSARFDLVVGRNVEQFRSYATYDAVGSTYPVVMYDPENWSATPLNEQQHPKVFMKAFVALAHERGQAAILAPSRGLASSCRRPGETMNAAFIRCGFAAIPTDYFQLQAQHLECDPTIYRDFVLAVSAQVQGQLVAQLSVLWGNPCVTADTIVASWAKVRTSVAGFAMWTGEGGSRSFDEQTAIALDALSRMQDA